MSDLQTGESVPRVDPAQMKTAKLSWRTAGLVLLQALGGGLVGFLGVSFVLGQGLQLAPKEASKALMLLVFALSMALAIPLQIIVHELGHAIAGRLMGGYLLRFVVGPWRCSRYRSGFRWQRVRSLKGIGGFVQTVMPADARFRRAMSVMLLGGPLANLALAGLAWLGLLVEYWPVRILALNVLLFGTFLGLINLVPLRIAGFLTDGAQLLRFWTSPQALEHGLRMTRIARASIDGLRPREIAAADIAALDPDTCAGMERFVALAVRAAFAADSGDVAQARLLLDRALADWEQWPDGFRQSLAVAAAILSAEVDADAATAKAWLAKAEGGLLEEFHLAWVDALIAGLEGRTADRELALQRVRRALDDTVYRGDERMYREKLLAMDQGSAYAGTGELAWAAQQSK